MAGYAGISCREANSLALISPYGSTKWMLDVTEMALAHVACLCETDVRVE